MCQKYAKGYFSSDDKPQNGMIASNVLSFSGKVRQVLNTYVPRPNYI